MQDISVTLVYLAFLALPGFIGIKVYRQLTARSSKKNWEDFVEVLLFALLSYLACALSYETVNAVAGTHFRVDILDSLRSFDKAEAENIGEGFHWLDISLSCILGVMLGYGAAYLNNYMVVTRIGRTIGATKRYGDEDVWNFFHDSEKGHSWVYVRDHKLGLLYFGEIYAYSDSQKDRELVLKDVTVHDIASGERLYKRDVLYFSRDRFDLTVEIPDMKLRESTQLEVRKKEECENARTE